MYFPITGHIRFTNLAKFWRKLGFKKSIEESSTLPTEEGYVDMTYIMVDPVKVGASSERTI